MCVQFPTYISNSTYRNCYFHFFNSNISLGVFTLGSVFNELARNRSSEDVSCDLVAQNEHCFQLFQWQQTSV